MKNLLKINFILIILFLILTILKTQAQELRPNIIFILTDDQRWDAMGYAGNQIIKTPEMDKLASQGVYFRYAFVTTPICAASRASILTGMRERTHGYTFEQGNIPDKFMETSYPALLQKAGYYTGFFGKFGVNFPRFDGFFDECDDYDRNNKYNDRRGYFYKTIDGDTVHLTDFTGYQAMNFMRNAPKDKPFCLSLSFSAPHAHDSAPDQYFWQNSTNELYTDINIPGPFYAEDCYFQDQPWYIQQGFNRLRWTWRYDTEEKYQHSMKGYYRMISGVDAEIGKIRKVLAELGQDKNTIIIFMGDNGYFEGERQLAGKWLMYDNCLRVPMIIYDPRSPNHRDVDEIALNIDIAKTILEFAQVKIPEKLQGQSLAGFTSKSPAKLNRNSFICEHLWDNPNIPASEGIRTTEWKYFRYLNHPNHEELYDLRNDPDEVKNLVNDKSYKAKLDQLRRECNEGIEKIME